MKTVAMFVLIRVARLKKRIDIDTVRRKCQAELPDIIVEEWKKASAGV